MVGYRILCVGRRAQDPLLDAAEKYLQRLQRYAPVDLVRVRDGTLASERAQLQRHIPKGSRVVALDERGKNVTTRELAASVQSWQAGTQNVVFLLGGADGLDAELKKEADLLLGLSKLTLPHRLALVLLLEQLYRAHTLLRGEPYHRD